MVEYLPYGVELLYEADDDAIFYVGFDDPSLTIDPTDAEVKACQSNDSNE